MRITFVFIVFCFLMFSWSCRPKKSESVQNQLENNASALSEANKSEEAEEEPSSEAIVESTSDDSEAPADDDKKTKSESKKSKKSSNITSKKAGRPSSKFVKGAAEGDFSKDYLMGKFVPSKHEDFTTIKSVHASRGGMYLRKDTYEAFQQMYNAALKDGVRLTIISATRPFGHQKRIWEAKWQGKRKVSGRNLPPVVKDPEKRAKLILMYSSMPGTSRHHWGTDIDLNDLNNPYFEKGVGLKIYEWLVEHAGDYGFCQVYSEMGDDRPNGYQEEKWHWSYVPVARQLTNQYQAKIKNEDISGFLGAETAVTIDMVNNYVLGINPDCK